MFARARTQTTSTAKRPGSNIALAIALMSVSALGMTAMATPAEAAKKKKKSKAPKADYSKEFLAAYTPLEALSKAEAPDAAALRAGVSTLVPSLTTADDRWAGGGLIYNIGISLNDNALKRQGMDFMADSGKAPEGKAGQYFFNAGQLAYEDGDNATARARFTQALGAGFTEANLEAVIAETYFRDDNYAEGLSYLRGQVMETARSGQTPREDWLRRGIAMAYNNDLVTEAVAFSALNAQFYPSTTSWGDAIAIQRNFFDFDANTILDLLRLSDRTDSLRNGRDFADYIDAADARRLPGEVSRVVDEGIAAGHLETSDPFVKDVRDTARARLAADKAELPVLERDARKPGATAVTASAAGDVMLSYGMAAKAEEMYTIALTKPGVDTNRVLTRLGIAQSDQGKTAEAKATFDKVQGERGQVAALWNIYVDQQAAAAAPAPVGRPTMAEEAAM